MRVAKVFFIFFILSSCAGRENKVDKLVEDSVSSDTSSKIITDTIVREHTKCDTSIKYDLPDISSEGAEAEVCYSRKKAIKASLFIYGAMGRSELFYLFKPSFVEVKERNYQYQKSLTEVKDDGDIKLTDSAEYVMSMKGDIIKGNSNGEVQEIYKAFLEVVPLSLK